MFYIILDKHRLLFIKQTIIKSKSIYIRHILDIYKGYFVFIEQKQFYMTYFL